MRLAFSIVSVFLFLGVSAVSFVAHAGKVPKLVDSFGGHSVCDQLDRLFAIPENQGYLNSDKIFKFSELVIPDDVAGFQQVEWQTSNEEEYAQALPDEHEKNLSYAIREDTRDRDIKSVKKADIDIYNRGTSNKIYRIFFPDNSYRNYIYEPNPIRLGFKRIFNDNASDADPFIYEGELLTLEKRGNRIWIKRYKTIRQGQPPVQMFCDYKL